MSNQLSGMFTGTRAAAVISVLNTFGENLGNLNARYDLWWWLRTPPHPPPLPPRKKQPSQSVTAQAVN